MTANSVQWPWKNRWELSTTSDSNYPTSCMLKNQFDKLMRASDSLQGRVIIFQGFSLLIMINTL